MPYNSTQQYLFIHIPKNAGGSITTALSGKERAYRPRGNKLKMGALALLGSAIKKLGRGDLSTLFGAYPLTLSLEHLTYREIELLQLIPSSTLKSAFTFCVIRNPWERAVSSYFSHDRHKKYKSFEDFCIRWFEPQGNISHDELAHRRPQYDFVVDLEGNNAMDYILKYESLNDDFAVLLDKMGLSGRNLPHIHRRTNNSGTKYRSLYTNKAKNKISQLFECDLDYFKYTF